MSAIETSVDAAKVLARLDRLPRRAVSYAATGIAGLALFFVFYCNFNINVSFIQTCTQIQPGCTPGNAQSSLVLPTCLYLLGYFGGGLIFAPFSDRIGRKRSLAFALSFACLGSLLAAVATGYPLFVLARAITGISMGAVLPVANTYIGEIAPAAARAKYTAITFVLCTLGAMCGIGFGLLLTTEAAPFPEGLPFAFGVEAGWRWMYGLAALIGVLALVSTWRLPESPRWLIEHGRTAEAHEVVSSLERRVRGPLPEPAASVPLPPQQAEHAYRELLSSKRYRRRVLLLVAMWFTGYATVFSYSTGSTVILTSLHFTAPVAGMISAVGGVGFFVQGLFSAKWSERLDRRYWLPIGAVLTVLGGVLIATLGTSIGWAFAGSFLVFFGFNVWVPPTFALSAESFPTRIRSAGFGLVDGVGVLGGAMGVLVIAPLVPRLSPLPALLMIAGFLVVSAILAQFTPHTRNRMLEDVSP
ncbi:sugar porter family MFS transporter [Amycolatopsis acidiphila]|uniref:Sugar porter family MFS transporter n=1 Tax=Amycolatopsis acidiphila TaxID=715473 RepID=A0A558AE87_9PSEU|nr:MFS transporter [Amycolatopsis acidiphila]TVT22576.1 sugar porter family MFS transporter [Amycolatopsis acidiphila]UIJ58787.1 sugar porter family MFS transporter [Amycolatopsis acidiphila]GHG71954.1 MFS transporter [Amycolatopsis acidiphila]